MSFSRTLTESLFSIFLKKKTLFFLGQFQVYNKIESSHRTLMYREYVQSSHVQSSHRPPTHAQIASPIVNILHQSGTFITDDEPTVIDQNHQSPQFTVGFTLGVVHSMGLDKCIMAYIHHCYTQTFLSYFGVQQLPFFLPQSYSVTKHSSRALQVQ